MFCPKCGIADQTPETYCRHCGLFLPDLSKAKKEYTPHDHLRANTALSVMTIIASLALAVTLYLTLAFRSDTPIVIYITAGFLLAMAGWQIQVFVRTLKLRKQLKQRGIVAAAQPKQPDADSAVRELKTADFGGEAPPSVTDRTTRNLVERAKRSA